MIVFRVQIQISRKPLTLWAGLRAVVGRVGDAVVTLETLAALTHSFSIGERSCETRQRASRRERTVVTQWTHASNASVHSSLRTAAVDCAVV